MLRLVPSCAVVLTALAACGNPARQQATALAQAVDRYRHASDGPSRQAQGEAVAAVACTDARVCDAKQACVAAIEPTTRALALKDEVTLRLGDLEHGRLDAGAPEAQALPGKLDEASRLLQDARGKMTTCDAKLAELAGTIGG